MVQLVQRFNRISCTGGGELMQWDITDLDKLGGKIQKKNFVKNEFINIQ